MSCNELQWALRAEAFIEGFFFVFFLKEPTFLEFLESPEYHFLSSLQ